MSLKHPLPVRREVLKQGSLGKLLSSPRDQEARTQEAPMWFWWQIWFDWWFPPSRPTHEVVTVDFSQKRVIKRLAS